MNRLPGRFWLESGLAVMSVVLLLATLLWRDWIEIVFRVDPEAKPGPTPLSVS